MPTFFSPLTEETSIVIAGINCWDEGTKEVLNSTDPYARRTIVCNWDDAPRLAAARSIVTLAAIIPLMRAGFITSVTELVVGFLVDLSRGITVSSSLYHSKKIPTAAMASKKYNCFILKINV